MQAARVYTCLTSGGRSGGSAVFPSHCIPAASLSSWSRSASRKTGAYGPLGPARRWSSASPVSSLANEAAKNTSDNEAPPSAAPSDAATASAPTENAPQAPLVGSAEAAAKRQRARDAIIQEILSRDKVVFELKRQHELSMLRVEQNQSRVLKDQEDRGMYYEQNSNVHTFDTISVGLYSQRSTLYHTLSVERLRNLKIFLTVLTTIITCVYLYYRYMINPEWEYVDRPMKMIGSRVQALREQRWKLLSDDEKFAEMRYADASHAVHNA